MARLAGFEPTTPWFVAKYSIQLSYSREALNYSNIFAAFKAATRKFLHRPSKTEQMVGRVGLEPTTKGL